MYIDRRAHLFPGLIIPGSYLIPGPTLVPGPNLIPEPHLILGATLFPGPTLFLAVRNHRINVDLEIIK